MEMSSEPEIVQKFFKGLGTMGDEFSLSLVDF
jgi:hypothetical protein